MAAEMPEQARRSKIRKLNALIDAICGTYSRVARRLGVHRTFVSRVARGERQSPPVEDALVREYERTRPDEP
jgi:hypothetical protein